MATPPQTSQAFWGTVSVATQVVSVPAALHCLVPFSVQPSAVVTVQAESLSVMATPPQTSQAFFTTVSVATQVVSVPASLHCLVPFSVHPSEVVTVQDESLSVMATPLQTPQAFFTTVSVGTQVVSVPAALHCLVPFSVQPSEVVTVQASFLSVMATPPQTSQAFFTTVSVATQVVSVPAALHCLVPFSVQPSAVVTVQA